MTPSQETFLRLDPILRELLASVQNYREACTSATSKESILAILRAQVPLLDNLEVAIRGAVDKHGNGALQAQMAYVLLPLRLILQSSDWNADIDDPIWQSALWKSGEAAARVMDSAVRLIGSLLSFKQTLDCLSSCTFPLPTETVSSHSGKNGLDRGDDCMGAVLQCIDTLLCRANELKSQGEKASMTTEESLLARISFACTLLLAPDEGSTRKRNVHLEVQALHTLDTLMNVSPEPNLWQSFFPAIFGVLYRMVVSDLRLAPGHATPKVSSSACRTLSHLLRITLSTAGKEANESSSTSSTEVVNVLKRWEQVATCDPGEDTSDFLKQVHVRLPPPLVLLLNLLPNATSPKLREASADLCLSILVESRPVWEDREETNNVLQSAIECCIVLSRDNDARVASSATKTLTDYKLGSGSQPTFEGTIGPRILQLIEELPALARSGRENELRGRISLISGFLVLGSRSLRSSLTSVATEIQTSFAVLFDVDFDSIPYAPRVETTESWNVWQPDRCRFRFMMDATAASSREMVQLLGAALGQKSASSFADACVANVLEAYIDTNTTSFGPRQVDWLHRWVGNIIVACEVIVGAFREECSHNADSQGSTNSNLTRQRRKRVKRLHSIARAVLPVITSPPLWTLPTLLDNVDLATKESNERGNLTIAEVPDNSNLRTISASALKGNAAMVCSLIGLLREIVQLLSTEVEYFLPVILFPLCEKASSENHSHVQGTATLALHQVAESCRLSSTRDLIIQNFDYLFGAMLSQTRRPGIQATVADNSFPITIPSIVQIVLRSAADVHTTTATTEGVRGVRSFSDETHVSYVIELVNSLVASFDSNLVIFNRTPFLLVSTGVSLVQVFEAALVFIASTFNLVLDMESDALSGVQIPVACEDWTKALEPYRKGAKQESGEFMRSELFEDTRTQCDAERSESSPDSAESSNEQPSIEMTSGEIEFASLSLERCSFFLSSPSLNLEMASAICMQRAFALLGYVAKYSKPKKEEDEANGPYNAVHRYINRAWPSILSRLRSLSSTVVANSCVKFVSIRRLNVGNPSMKQDLSSQFVFLSKLFGLIATMCEASGSFMVSRIKDQLWPVVAELLNVYVQESKARTNHQLSADSLIPDYAGPERSYLTQRDTLLLSVLEFLARIYEEKECGIGLSSLIPTVGTLVLPFLASTEGHLRTRAMKALKTMMLVDCDALWRPLLQLSHRPLPPPPFGLRRSITEADVTFKCMTPLESGAEELVEFIESLPEQPLP